MVFVELVAMWVHIRCFKTHVTLTHLNFTFILVCLSFLPFFGPLQIPGFIHYKQKPKLHPLFFLH